MADSNRFPLLPEHIVTERTHLQIPSLPNWIEPTVEYLRQKAVMGGTCQDTRSGKLVVALHEAVTNAMIHGNLELSSELKEQGNSAFAEALAQRAADPDLSERIVDIVVDFDGATCNWIITDEGRGFDVDRVLARCLSDDPEVLLSSGRGILMMKSFLDDVRYSMGGRRVTMSLARDSGKEKRKDSRVPMTAPFQVTPVDPNGAPRWSDTYEAMSRNFSEHGISLLQKQLATSGQVLIGITTETGIVHIPAEVRHSRPLGAHGMELGCQFLESQSSEMPPSESPAVLSPQLEEVHRTINNVLETFQSNQMPSHERRIHTRVIFNERVDIRVDGRADSVVGYARDLSKGGMALITQEPLPGAVAAVFAPTENRESFKVRSKVVRCSLIQEGFYDIGLAFLSLDKK